MIKKMISIAALALVLSGCGSSNTTVDNQNSKTVIENPTTNIVKQDDSNIVETPHYIEAPVNQDINLSLESDQIKLLDTIVHNISVLNKTTLCSAQYVNSAGDLAGNKLGYNKKEYKEDSYDSYGFDKTTVVESNIYKRVFRDLHTSKLITEKLGDANTTILREKEYLYSSIRDINCTNYPFEIRDGNYRNFLYVINGSLFEESTAITVTNDLVIKNTNDYSDFTDVVSYGKGTILSLMPSTVDFTDYTYDETIAYSHYGFTDIRLIANTEYTINMNNVKVTSTDYPDTTFTNGYITRRNRSDSDTKREHFFTTAYYYRIDSDIQLEGMKEAAQLYCYVNHVYGGEYTLTFVVNYKGQKIKGTVHNDTIKLTLNDGVEKRMSL